METSSQSTRPRRGRSVVGPLLLIALGVLLLLNSLDLLPWNVWQTLWRFWPVVLILLGLELIVGRGSPWANGALIVLVLGVVAALTFFAAFLPFVPFGWSTISSSQTTVNQDLEVPLEGAREASVNVKFAAGRLAVGALAGDSTHLLQGEVREGRGPIQIAQGTLAQGDRVEVTIERQGGMPIGSSGDERWVLNLNPDIPLDLRFEGGAGEFDLDLRALQVRNLSVDLGAAGTRLRLPENAGFTRATIKTGMADLRVDVPEGVAARINASSGLGSLDIDERRFPKVGDTYQSPDYDTATNRVELDVDAGMASVRVR